MSSFPLLSSDEKAQLWACLALRHAENIGPRRAKLLTEHYHTPLAAVEAGRAHPSAWVTTGIVSERIAHAFTAEKWRTAAHYEWQAIQETPCEILVWTSPDYPPLLREVVDAPLLLYVKGDISLLQNPAVGVVGARSCTREGMAVSALFARGLSQAGVTIISGMARGIDRVAHLAGLEGPGRSIAVLGTGVDIIYPPNNVDLAKSMEEHGLIVSEFAPGTPAIPRNFPVRNRIISGLSRGILVVEAADRSGSLITARLALEQNREVFAVPGHTTAALSEGCRDLIRRGAKPVFNADDILHELAPLLHQDALQALEKRRQSTALSLPRHAESRHKALSTTMQDDAIELLPNGVIPWVAPLPPERAPRKEPASGKKTQRPARTAPLAAQAFTENTLDAPHKTPTAPVLSPEESNIVAALGSAPVHIDSLARTLSVEVAHLSSLLLMLEMRGVVRRQPGMLYTLPNGSSSTAAVVNSQRVGKKHEE